MKRTPSQEAGTHGKSLGAEVAALLPTPTTQDGSNVAGPSQEERNSPPLNALVRMLPTPNASLANYEESPETWVPRAERMRVKHNNGNGVGMPLPIALQLLPTPRASVDKEHGPNGQHWAELRPTVESLSSGANTQPRSTDGSKSPALRLSPWFVEWMIGAPAGWSDPACPLSVTEFRSSAATSSGDTSRSSWEDQS